MFFKYHGAFLFSMGEYAVIFIDRIEGGQYSANFALCQFQKVQNLHYVIYIRCKSLYRFLAYSVIAVPAFPASPSTAFSGEVMTARRPLPLWMKSTLATTFGSMEANSNWPWAM